MTINWEKLRYNQVLKHFMIIAILVLVGIEARAQYDVSFSHYWAMEPTFNPASVGKEPKLNVVGAYALDFAGFQNNPRTAYIGADMPIYFAKSYHGVGLSILNDKIGLFTHQRIAGQYAYRFRLLGGQLAAGLQVGILMENFDGSKVDVEDSSDPAFSRSEVTGNSIDLGAGLYYTHGRWYVGASVQHLNAPLVELGETNELQIDATYYLTGGYNIKLRNPFLSIPTSALVRYDGTAYRADIGGRLVYTNDKKMMYGGVSYSPTNSVTVLIGGSFHGINLGYSYEMYTSAVNPGNGSHELFVRYQTDINLQKKGRNKHKSVRIL
ncbi:MAG: type IX secretion system membrane protein PorP/SprF [Prevotella sp.]|nr:type IX secretion system membrane protein PorP/SprF [Prevotella sp.]